MGFTKGMAICVLQTTQSPLCAFINLQIYSNASETGIGVNPSADKGLLRTLTIPSPYCFPVTLFHQSIPDGLWMDTRPHLQCEMVKCIFRLFPCIF
jgi:hypothetical protein